MKKILKSMVIAMVMVCSMAVSIFANPADDLRKELLAVGVSSSDAAKVVEYLNKTTISKADYNKAMAYVEQAKAIIGDTKDLTKLSSDAKVTLKNLATKAGNTLGLNVTIDKSQGSVSIVVTDAKGGALLTMGAEEAKVVVENFKISEVVAVLESAVEYSNSSDKGNFTPVGGQLTQTATPYANIMVAGAAMIVVAGGIALVSKKQFA